MILTALAVAATIWTPRIGPTEFQAPVTPKLQTILSTDFRVETIEFTQPDAPVRFYAEVEERIGPNRRTIYEGLSACGWECQGKKHLEHSQCDTSCCVRCKRIHKGAVHFSARYDEAANLKLMEDVIKAAARFGVPGHSGDAWNLAGRAHPFLELANSKDWKDLTVNFSVPHFNDDPCAFQELKAEVSERELITTIRFYRVENGTTVRGPDVSGSVHILHIPTGKAVVSDPTLACACRVVFQEKAEPPEQRDPDPWEGYPSVPPGPLEGSDPKGTKPANDDTLKQTGLNFSCPDMNTFVCSGGPWQGGPDAICLPAGTICVPDNPSYQIEILLDDLVYNRDAFFAGPISIADKSVHAACIELTKKMPDSSVKYWPKFNFDPVLARIAKWVNKSERARGSWTQARFWIASDRPTYDELAKRLIPMPNKASFVQILFQCADIGKMNPGEESFGRILEPRMLAWGALNNKAIEWLAQQLAMRDPDGILKSIESEMAAFQSWQKGDQPRTEQLVTLVRTLSQSYTESARRAAAKLMHDGVLPENREAFSKAGGLEFLPQILMSSDSETVALAVDVAEQFSEKSSALALLNLSKELPDALRNRALELAKKLLTSTSAVKNYQ